MPIPAILYGAGSLIATAAFRLAAHPATPRIIDAAQKSMATMGHTLSNGFNQAAHAYDWLTGNDEPAPESVQTQVTEMPDDTGLAYIPATHYPKPL